MAHYNIDLIYEKTYLLALCRIEKEGFKQIYLFLAQVERLMCPTSV